jgi:hypothetical protein
MIWFRSAKSHRGRGSITASEAAQMAASDYVLIFFRNRLHLVGRPQIALGRPLSALNYVTIGS